MCCWKALHGLLYCTPEATVHVYLLLFSLLFKGQGQGQGLVLEQVQRWRRVTSQHTQPLDSGCSPPWISLAGVFTPLGHQTMRRSFHGHAGGVQEVHRQGSCPNPSQRGHRKAHSRGAAVSWRKTKIITMKVWYTNKSTQNNNIEEGSGLIGPRLVPDWTEAGSWFRNMSRNPTYRVRD